MSGGNCPCKFESTKLIVFKVERYCRPSGKVPESLNDSKEFGKEVTQTKHDRKRTEEYKTQYRMTLHTCANTFDFFVGVALNAGPLASMRIT